MGYPGIPILRNLQVHKWIIHLSIVAIPKNTMAGFHGIESQSCFLWIPSSFLSTPIPSLLTLLLMSRNICCYTQKPGESEEWRWNSNDDGKHIRYPIYLNKLIVVSRRDLTGIMVSKGQLSLCFRLIKYCHLARSN